MIHSPCVLCGLRGRKRMGSPDEIWLKCPQENCQKKLSFDEFFRHGDPLFCNNKWARNDLFLQSIHCLPLSTWTQFGLFVPDECLLRKKKKREKEVSKCEKCKNSGFIRSFWQVRSLRRPWCHCKIQAPLNRELSRLIWFNAFAISGNKWPGIFSVKRGKKFLI